MSLFLPVCLRGESHGSRLKSNSPSSSIPDTYERKAVHSIVAEPVEAFSLPIITICWLRNIQTNGVYSPNVLSGLLSDA